MSKNSIIPFLKDYLINFLTSPFLLDTNVILYNYFVSCKILVNISREVSLLISFQDEIGFVLKKMYIYKK